MLILDNDHREAYAHAIAWARANPDKIVSGDLALNSETRRAVSTLDPKADCFCVLGRIARELGRDVTSTDAAVALVEDMPGAEDNIGDLLWVANDGAIYTGKGDVLAGFNLLEKEMNK